MINANECKVGNRFIRELHNERGLEYDHDFVLTEEWMGKLFGSNIGIALQDLFPIPITPEILEACGFEYEHGQIEMYRNNNIWMYWDGKSLSANFGHIEQLDVEISTLHQLQNLYFALTNKELTYNPKKP